MTITNATATDVAGLCFLCREELPSNDSRIHAHDCMETLVSEAAPDDDIMLISAWCEERPHWLELAVRPTATLGDLDRFLRRVWLDCCDHQSRFIVRKQLDLAGKPTAVDWQMENILVRADERYIREPMEDILDHGTEFDYQYVRRTSPACSWDARDSSPSRSRNCRNAWTDPGWKALSPPTTSSLSHAMTRPKNARRAATSPTGGTIETQTT